MKCIPLGIIFVALALTGCEEPKPYKPPTPTSSERLFDTQRRALEQAKTVEGSIEQSAAQQREAIEQTR